VKPELSTEENFWQNTISDCSAARGFMRILIAEDDKASQIAISALMERLGCDAHVVGDGAQAVNALADSDYDLILMDLMMPICDGIEATSAIRALESKHSQRTPIVAMTASNFDARECLTAGMDDFLAKPYSVEDLRRILAKYMKDRA
jgi:CheY-like chemotaxis protein